MIGGFLSSPGIKKFTAPNAPRYRANASLIEKPKRHYY
jgi:hypothetical protein